MKRIRIYFATLALAVGSLMVPGVTPPMPTVAAAGDWNAYFDALVPRPDFWKGFSLRPKPGQPATSPYYEKQFETRAAGGYQNSNSAPKFVTFDPGMDAAKVVIPPFVATGTLATTLSATDTRLYPTQINGAFVLNVQLRIDSEVMQITQLDAKDKVPRGMTVTRGLYGTSAAPHTAGALINSANSSLPNQMRFPLGTEDGNTYVFTWDVLFSSSFLGTGLAGNKTFQITRKGDNIWLEVKTMMEASPTSVLPGGFDKRIHVGSVISRAYLGLGGDPNWLLSTGGQLGPGVTKADTLLPIVGTFTLFPNRWTRYWVQIEQRANDYDYYSLWMADEVQAPVRIYNRVPMSLGQNGNGMEKFWIEFNDSAARLPAGRVTDFRDLVAYMRNLAILRNPGDIQPLLVRPVPGLVPQAGPSPPRNVRITT